MNFFCKPPCLRVWRLFLCQSEDLMRTEGELCQTPYEALFGLFSLDSVCLHPVNLPIVAQTVCDKDYEFKGLLFCCLLVWFKNIATVFNVLCSWSAASLCVCLLHQMLHESEECDNAKRRSQGKFEDKCRNFSWQRGWWKICSSKEGEAKIRLMVSAGNSSLWISSTEEESRNISGKVRVNFVASLGCSLNQTAPHSSNVNHPGRRASPCADKPPTSAQIQIKFHSKPLNPTKLTTEVTTSTCWFHSGRLKQKEQEKQRPSVWRDIFIKHWRFYGRWRLLTASCYPAVVTN